MIGLVTEVLAVRRELLRVVAALDPDSVSLPRAPELWEEFDRIEKLAASAKTLLARRVDQSGRWARDGHKDAADYLAAKGGCSRTAAQKQLDTSKRLPDLPATEAAIRQGALSTPQAEAITDAAAVNPDAEAKLLDTATRSSLGELRDACGRAKAKDRDETHRRIHRDRRLRHYTDSEGAWNLSARGTVDAGADVEAALNPIIDELFTAARLAGLHEAREAYAFDALVELARRAAEGAGHEAEAKPKRRDPTHLTLVRVDLEALRRGEVDGDELCELTGIGPIPVRVARDLLGDSIVKLIITKGVDVLNVTHLGRQATVAQRMALLWMSPLCTVQGCNRTRVEIDHRDDWADTHVTRLDRLEAHCKHHHDLKTHHGWALVEGTGKRPMVSPDDPRHPHNRAGPAPPTESP